ncbi:MAG: DUF2891 domain-containing protein [Wenzhouxiangella sp.]|nr:MAG: DUF2891 domain-containing protein [Wenzhouxiangella sp.]
MPGAAPLILVALLCGKPAMAEPLALDEATAGRFAALALACVDREYPNQIRHVMTGDDDAGTPRQLTPSFYGCFDWHSAVHGHWLLVRLSRLFPDADFAVEAKEKLAANLTRDKLLAEAAYMAHPERAGFQRPYGLAWLLQLVAELDEWDDEQASHWRDWLRPAEEIALSRLHDWIPLLHYPIRDGEHSQTAFAFGLVHDYARSMNDERTLALLADAAERFYRTDRNCPLSYEPSGHDFLSPCLAEADFMRRVLEPGDFAGWLDDFLPPIGEENWLPVAVVTDREDGKLAHIDGLNLSRAWMLNGMAQGLPDEDVRREALLNAASAHAESGLEGVTDEFYAGSHWLASFATYLASGRGIR